MPHRTNHVSNPQEALAELKAGNKRFATGNTHDHDYQQQILATRSTQNPFAVVLCCMDSRQPAELIFDQGIGNLLVLRVAGNILNPDIIGSIEFATSLLEAKLIVVVGHRDCGAIRGACKQVELGQLTPLLQRIQPAITAANQQLPDDCDELELINTASRINVSMVMEAIPYASEILRKQIQANQIDVAGALYDVGSGETEWIQCNNGKSNLTNTVTTKT